MSYSDSFRLRRTLLAAKLMEVKGVNVDDMGTSFLYAKFARFFSIICLEEYPFFSDYEHLIATA